MRLSTLLCTMVIGLAASAAENLDLKTIDFQQLTVRGPLNVDYVHCPDSAGMVLISGPDAEQLSWVEVSSAGRKLSLVLKVPAEVTEIPANLPRVKVYSSWLTKVENEGDSTVRVLSVANVADFKAGIIGNGRMGIHNLKAGNVSCSILSGNGTMAISGECTEAALKITGAGVIQADALKSQTASVWCTGTGSVGVWAVNKLSIKGAGSGTVFVVGTPEIKKHTVGVKVQPIE